MRIIKNLPNILTISRIMVIPIIIGLLYFEKSIICHQLSAGLFMFAAITDFLDGYIARTWSVQSNLGRFLDPIADKLLVGAVILMLVHLNKVSILPAIAIICREILVSGLREFLAEIRVSVPVSKLAKIKTFFQMLSIFILMLGTIGSNIAYTDLIGEILLWCAAALTLFTGYAYLKAGLSYVADND